MTHYLALSRLQGTAKDDSKKAAEEIGTCFVGVDRQRADAMRSSKLVALLGQPAVTPAKEPPARIAIKYRQGEGPNDLALSPDGGLAVVGKMMGDVEIYDTRTAQILRVIRTGSFNYVHNLRFSPNGRVLFLSSRQHRGLKIYDPYTGELLREYDGVMGPFELLPGGRFVLHGDGHIVRLYDATTNKALEPSFPLPGQISHVAVSPDAKRAAVMSTDRKVTLWDLVAGETGVTLKKGPDAETEIQLFPMARLVFTRSGDALLGASHEGTLTRWSLPDLKRVQVSPMGRVHAGELLRLPDTNRIVLPGAGKDGQISHVLFWDLDRDVAATVPMAWVGNGLQIASTPLAPFLYIASVAGIAVVDVPEEKSYRPSPNVLEPLIEPAQIERHAPIVRVPMLRGAADGATVEAVGVYEGRPPPGPVIRGARPRVPGPRPVNLVVGRTERPVILVLSSYEPVEWLITQSPEARVKHVLLSGSPDSVVVNRRPVEITRIGGAYTYQLNATGYAALESSVRQYLGKGIDRFQGAYNGSEFSIGASAPAGRAGAAGRMYRCADARGQAAFVDRPCSELGLQDRGVVAPPPAIASGTAPAGPGAPRPPGRTATPGRQPHERIIQCGRTTIVCDANDTVMCGGREVACR